MGIILDIVIIAIFLLSVFLGYKRGLINVIFNLCAFILAIVVTWILYTPVTNFVVNNAQLDESIKSVIIEKGVVPEDTTKDEEKDEVSKYIDQYVSKTVNSTRNEVVKSTADIIAEKTVAIIVAIGLFIVVRIALLLVRFVANGLAELPIIKQFNEAGGLVYGVIRGLFVIYLLFAICFIIMSVNNIETVANVIDSTILSKFIYNHNILLDIIFFFFLKIYN